MAQGGRGEQAKRSRANLAALVGNNAHK